MACESVHCCKLYPEQHRRGSKACPAASEKVAGAYRQRCAKIDGCRLQNPAYRPDRKSASAEKRGCFFVGDLRTFLMQSLILEICDCPSAFSFASPKENEPGWISISLRPSLNRPEKPLRFFWTFPAKFGAVQNFRRYSYALRRGRCLRRPLRNSGEFVLLFTFLTQGVFSADIKS